MAKNHIELRRKRYFKLSSQIAQLDNAQLRSLFDNSESNESSTRWGMNHTIILGESKVFVKRVAVTNIEFDKMNINLVGDKNIFAIEYSVLMINPSPPYGNCIIWLEGKPLGGLEGEVYLNIVYKRLEGKSLIRKQLFLEEYLYNLPDTELFDLMQEQKIDEKGTYWFMYTEGFDLFNTYIYRRDEIFHFLWQLDPEVWEKFKPQGISTQLFSAQVAISMYEEVVMQFKSILLKMYNF